jgi:hypothetical protein
MAFSTASLVSGFTTGSPFNTLETVAMDTPAILATDFKLAGCFWEVFKSNRFVCKRFQSSNLNQFFRISEYRLLKIENLIRD